METLSQIEIISIVSLILLSGSIAGILAGLIGVGGGTKSEYWVNAIATALDMAIDIPVAGDFGRGDC